MLVGCGGVRWGMVMKPGGSWPGLVGGAGVPWLEAGGKGWSAEADRGGGSRWRGGYASMCSWCVARFYVLMPSQWRRLVCVRMLPVAVASG